MARQCDPTLEMKYNKFYIGLSLLSGNFVDGAGQVTGREQENGLFGCYRLELGFGRLGLFGLGDSQCTSANLFSRN
jgi:hypothetical protein